MKFSLVAVLLTAASIVAAHGTMSEMVIGGQTYTGPDAAEGKPFWTTNSPIRQLSRLEPMTNFTSPDTQCGPDAHVAKLVANATAGSSFSFKMRGGEGGNWPHMWGPVMAYLGKCDNSATCDPSGISFVKASELGLKSGADNVWYQQDLSEGNSLSLTIPKDISNGDYLLRVEIIALHNAMNVGGAETTVSCTQIRVTGGTTTPALTKTNSVTFPTTYKTGILINIWNGLTSYAFPGPAPISGSKSTGSAGSSSSVASSSSSSAPINVAPSPTGTTVPTQTKVCRRRRSRRAVVVDGATMGRRSLHGGAHRYASLH